MGQPVGVVARRVVRSGVVRFEIDRSLTGTGHELYRGLAGAVGDRPPDVLAARLFATAPLQAVHVFSNLITVTALDEAFADEEVDALEGVIRNLFIHYLPGVLPTAV